jgi:hypothetical protein
MDCFSFLIMMTILSIFIIFYIYISENACNIYFFNLTTNTQLYIFIGKVWELTTQEMWETPELVLKWIFIADLCLGKHRMEENNIMYPTGEEMWTASVSLSTSVLDLSQGQLRPGKNNESKCWVCFHQIRALRLSHRPSLLLNLHTCL